MGEADAGACAFAAAGFAVVGWGVGEVDGGGGVWVFGYGGYGNEGGDGDEEGEDEGV